MQKTTKTRRHEGRKDDTESAPRCLRATRHAPAHCERFTCASIARSPRGAEPSEKRMLATPRTTSRVANENRRAIQNHSFILRAFVSSWCTSSSLFLGALAPWHAASPRRPIRHRETYARCEGWKHSWNESPQCELPCTHGSASSLGGAASSDGRCRSASIFIARSIGTRAMPRSSSIQP